MTRVQTAAVSTICTAAILFGSGGNAQNVHPDGTVDGISDRTVELPSGNVFYRDSGSDGIPVVFLHAGSGNSMVWEYQIPAFVEAGYRFIAINHRGEGVTEREPGSSSRRINELIAILGIEQFHLLGTVAGGGVALEYALDNQDRLRSLIVTNSLGNVGGEDYRAVGDRLRPPGEFNQMTGDADLYTPPSVLRLFVERIDHAEYFIIPETGHSSFWENPEVFNQRVLEFIAQH